jgi:hypothetical protein
MKCIFVNCKCKSTINVEKQWLDKEIIGFCDKHAPAWSVNLKINELSPLGGHYKKV